MDAGRGGSEEEIREERKGKEMQREETEGREWRKRGKEETRVEKNGRRWNEKS